MRHQVDGRKFGRNTSHRTAMFKNMAVSLIMSEYMVTTVQKAKELRRVVDRLVTLGKSGTLGSKRLAFARTRDRDAVVKLFGTLAERYSKRPGGYTRVLRVDNTRWGDGAEMAMVELVDRPIIEKKKKVKTKKADDKHDHDEADHDHDHGTEKKKAHTAAPSKGKLSEKTKGPKTAKAVVRKTGGSRGGGSSS